MALVRKGLALRNNFLEHEVREMNKPLKKQGITPRRVTKSEKYPFEIYVDPIDINCQHCGSARSGSTVKPACKPKLSIQVVETATQTESDSEGTSDLKALLCNENPPEKYWEELAEQRRLALKETLDENQQLCDLVEKLNREMERLSELNKHTEHFAQMYLKICNESGISPQAMNRANSDV